MISNFYIFSHPPIITTPQLFPPTPSPLSLSPFFAHDGALSPNSFPINYNNCVSEKGSGIWSVVDDCDGDGLNRFVFICFIMILF